MSQVYCIRRRKGKHLQYTDRQDLEYLVRKIIRPREEKRKDRASSQESWV